MLFIKIQISDLKKLFQQKKWHDIALINLWLETNF